MVKAPHIKSSIFETTQDTLHKVYNQQQMTDIAPEDVNAQVFIFKTTNHREACILHESWDQLWSSSGKGFRGKTCAAGNVIVLTHDG